MKRGALEPYQGQRLFCRGQVREIVNNFVCFEFVQVEPPSDQPMLYFGHVWIRRGLTSDMLGRLQVGEWYSFTAKVWRYQRQKDGKWTGEIDYGLAYPEGLARSYSS